jgi:hypothetical protein
MEWDGVRLGLQSRGKVDPQPGQHFYNSRDMTAAAVTLPADFLAMMDRGVSVIVSSAGLDLQPSVMRAVGSRIDAGGGQITVYVSRQQSGQLLQDIASTGRLAVVFCEPSTHRTVQLKARQAQIRCAEPSDEPALARYLESMIHEISLVGHSSRFTRAMLNQQLDDVVAISFVPADAFDQTPGPQAGARLHHSAGANP